MPGSPRTFHLDALVLKHMDYGEADRIVVVFSKERGKVRTIAKGVRKLHSRKAGHLEPFTNVHLFLAQGRDIPIITQAQTIEPFSTLRGELNKIGYASYTIELLDRFSSEDGANQPLYQLSLDTLQRLEKTHDPFTAIQYYELHLLEMQGFKPELFSCVRCRKTIQAEDQFFSAELGGVLCPDCGPLIQKSLAVSLITLKYLRHFQRSVYQKVAQVAIEPRVREDMSRLMQQYITFLLERRLNSPDFINVIEHLNLPSRSN
jgi:DNA repair protein RecO (recombination protein O)